MDDSNEDQRLPHQCDPPVPVSLDELKRLGVLYFHFDIDDAGKYKWVFFHFNIQHDECILVCFHFSANYSGKQK